MGSNWYNIEYIDIEEAFNILTLKKQMLSCASASSLANRAQRTVRQAFVYYCMFSGIIHMKQVKMETWVPMEPINFILVWNSFSFEYQFLTQRDPKGRLDRNSQNKNTLW